MSWSYTNHESQIQNSQVSSTTNRIPRTPEHYEMIDQIGKGKVLPNNFRSLHLCRIFDSS